MWLPLANDRWAGRADIHRIDCRACGRVRTEQVPWARPNARHTGDFENVVAWLAQRMDKTSIGRLLRCSWEAAVPDRVGNNGSKGSTVWTQTTDRSSPGSTVA